MGITAYTTMLLITSTLTGLVTQAVKNILDEHGITYASNTLAGIVAAVVGFAAGIVSIVASGAVTGAVAIVYLASLILLSWLCAMVGYDKVIQTLGQLTED